MKIEVNDIMYGSFKINGIEKDIEVSIMAAWGDRCNVIPTDISVCIGIGSNEMEAIFIDIEQSRLRREK